MNAIVGDRVTELAETMTDLTVDGTVYATKQGAVIAVTQDGLAQEAVERYRRVHKTRKLGL